MRDVFWLIVWLAMLATAVRYGVVIGLQLAK